MCLNGTQREINTEREVESPPEGNDSDCERQRNDSGHVAEQVAL